MHWPAISLSFSRQRVVVPGGFPAQFRPCGEVALPSTSPLTVSGAEALPRPISTVVPPTLAGAPHSARTRCGTRRVDLSDVDPILKTHITICAEYSESL